MPTFRTGTVTSILSEREGLQRVVVGDRRAYVLTQLVGAVAVGDRVVVNTTAVELGLGTGGWDVVHWNTTRDSFTAVGGGHVMKLRYTSLQCDTGVAEEHDGYRDAALDGMAVVVCAVHSQLPAVAAAFKHGAPHSPLVYVMTDAAALPLALSDLVAALRQARLIDATVTAGHAFGGDYEGVNAPSALRVARSVAGAAAVVVGPGPGGVGTATELGYGGIEVAAILDAVRRDGGVPIAAVRWSDADARERHQGLSHHSRTALARTNADPIVPIPRGGDVAGVGEGHVEVVDVPDVVALLDGVGIAVTTMERTAPEDAGFFRYAGAAGVVAAGVAASGVMR